MSIDTGCKVAGWCGDSAVTLAIGAVRPEIQKLLDVTSKKPSIWLSGPWDAADTGRRLPA